MYKKMTLKGFKHHIKELPGETGLWLTEESINSLKENICPEDLQNVKAILYQDFLKDNPSFLNFA